MKLFRKVTGGGKQKAWSQPNFWASNAANMYGTTGLATNKEWLDHDFESYVSGIFKDNGVVYSCVQTRMLVFSEARMAYQRLEKGRPGELFSKPDLDIFETLPNMLSIMELDASIAGNSYITKTDDQGRYGNSASGKGLRLTRLKPSQVEIVIFSPSGNPWAPDARIGGYLYRPYQTGGVSSVQDDEHGAAILLMPDEVAHYAPMPDPQARFRGMSWLTPVLREIGADKFAMEHKKQFFRGGATLGHVIKFPEGVGQDDYDQFVAKFKASHEGVDNAYKTLFLGGGADVSTVGVDLRQLEFSQTQGHGETRIAAASGVPPVIVGLSEGLQAATYSNYSQARRRFADGTLRPLWRLAAHALSKLVEVPDGARLWYDDRDVAFLRDDKKEEAEIVETTARAAKALVDAGWEDESVKKYLVSRNPMDLKHTGLVSVQLLPPGTQVDPFTGQPKPGGGQDDKKPADDKKPSAKPKPRPVKMDVSQDVLTKLLSEGWTLVPEEEN